MLTLKQLAGVIVSQTGMEEYYQRQPGDNLSYYELLDTYVPKTIQRYVNYIESGIVLHGAKYIMPPYIIPSLRIPPLYLCDNCYNDEEYIVVLYLMEYNRCHIFTSYNEETNLVCFFATRPNAKKPFEHVLRNL